MWVIPNFYTVANPGNQQGMFEKVKLLISAWITFAHFTTPNEIEKENYSGEKKEKNTRSMAIDLWGSDTFYASKAEVQKLYHS